MQCDGAHDIDESVLDEDKKRFMGWLKEAEIIKEAGILDYLTKKQEYRTFPARYKKHAIPLYFEDDAPLSIMLGQTLWYTPGDPKYTIYSVSECFKEDEAVMPTCGVLIKNFYIGADGMVCPCMGMADCSYASHFPNLFKTPLKEILGDSEFCELCHVTVGDVRDHNSKCRQCRFIDRCTGGCRNAVLLNGDDYYGIDTNLCWFFENGGEERIRVAAKEPFDAYLKRNPPKERKEREEEFNTLECL